MKVSVIIPVYNVEKYIRSTLESIQNQTLADYEALVINDASTDNSQRVIDEFCASDWRFRSYQKENSGVSETRNFGLDRAKGEYVFFADGDDIVPPEALERMYQCAKEKDADMVVGMMREFGIYGLRPILVTDELAAKESIDRYDVRLPWIFSVCNKLFRRSVIEEHHLRFEKVRYTEDGLFSFHFTFCCKTIAGCKTVAYLYRKRSFWDENSVTQAATESYLRDLLMALEKILELTRAQREIAVRDAAENDDGEFLYVEYAKSHMALYMAELYRKFIRIQFLKGFYRQLWKSDDGMLALLTESIQEYKRHLFPEMWKDIVAVEKDLRLNEGILTKEELAKRPLITVAVSDQVPDAYLNRVIESLYCQSCPAFVIYVHAKHKDALDARYLQKKNLTLLTEDMDTAAFKNCILDQAASPYIAFIDEPLYMGITTYERYYRSLEQNTEADFATCRLKLVNEEGEAENLPMHIVCTMNKVLPKRQMAYCAIDWPMGHKLFRVSALRKKNIRFTKDAAADSVLCYKKLTYNAFDSCFMLIELSRKEYAKRIPNPRVKLTWRYRYMRMLSQSDAGRKRRKADWQRRVWDVKKKIIQRMPTWKKALFVSGTSDRLSENSRAVYDALGAKKCIWAHRTRSKKDLPALYFALFTSKVIVADDTFSYFKSFRLKPEQKIIQLWHETGEVRMFGLDSPQKEIGDREHHVQYDAVAVGGEGARETFVSAFGISPEKMEPIGVPQTDKWFDGAYLQREREAFFRRYPQFSGKKILLYAPEYREDREKRLKLNCERFREWLGEDRVLLIRNAPLLKYDFLKGRTFPNMFHMQEESLDRLLIVCDLLIADYGSVMFDAALLKKPLVRFCPDLDICGGLLYPKVWEDLYGETARDQKQLLEACEKALDKPDLSGLPAFAEKYLGNCDGHSTARAVERIMQKLNE